MEVSIGGRSYALSETLHSDELAPIFADAWTASRVWYASCFMAEQLVAFAAEPNQRFDVASRSVIELGSGCGLVGLVAAALGGDVLLTDQHEAVDLLRRNASDNMHSADEKQRVAVAEYQWGTPPAHAELPRTTYDFILVSDCINPIYGTESWRNLARSIHMLSGDATITYLAHEARGDDEAMEDFQAFSAAFLSFEVVAQQPEKRLKLYKIRRQHA